MDCLKFTHLFMFGFKTGDLAGHCVPGTLCVWTFNTLLLFYKVQLQHYVVGSCKKLLLWNSSKKLLVIVVTSEHFETLNSKVELNWAVLNLWCLSSFLLTVLLTVCEGSMLMCPLPGNVAFISHTLYGQNNRDTCFSGFRLSPLLMLQHIKTCFQLDEHSLWVVTVYLNLI